MRHEGDRSARPMDFNGLFQILDHDWQHDRRVIAARRRFQAVAECFPQPAHGELVGKDRHPAAGIVEIAAQIVDAVNMVGMRMRVEDSVHMIDPCPDHLLAKIRTCVDNDSRCRAAGRKLLNHKGCACSLILRIVGVAGTPVTCNARHAG